ncbi:MAG TPA: toll/interleukin-1 receptor domain-containing protein [Solirubrobacteraceae bacterium]|nr:toll/interleukin-1 receptor domain-containing protein [Solirubrobacteraceae bacterium]
MSYTHDVFMSHDSLDKEVVRDLAICLRDRGLQVWFDEWEVRPGDSIPSKIEAGLEGSRVLLFCNSEHAVGSAWAKFELQAFQFRDPLNRERRYVVLRLDDTPLTVTLAPFLYIDWRNGDAEEFEKLVVACRSGDAEEFEKLVLASRTPVLEAEGTGPRITPTEPISVDGSERRAAARQFDDTSNEHASVRIGNRYASFDIPHGWAERTGVELSAIQAIEGDLGTVHSQLYRINNPDLIYALTIMSTDMPASMLTSKNIPKLVHSSEQHTGLRAGSDVTPVSLDGAAGWLWHLQGVVPGALFDRPQVATMDVQCSEMWVPIDASTAIKMLLTAPRASAREAADELSSVILSWQWGDVESASRRIKQPSGSPNVDDMFTLANMWWHRVGVRKDTLPSYDEACRRCGGTNKLLYSGASCPDCNGTGRRPRPG